jgi:purine catabolism regulator
MGITVREILQLDIFKNAKVIAGHNGLHREVLFVDVIEVPDVGKWVRKDTLLLTTAFAIQNNEDKLRELVKMLAEGDASVLAVKLGRFIDAIPDQVINVANNLDFPIICLPLDVAYTDIINSVLSNILHKQANILRLGDELHQRLNKMVLVGGGLPAVASTLAEVINRPVFIENQHGDLLAQAAETEDKKKYQLLKGVRNRKKPGTLFKEKTFAFLGSSAGNQILVPILAGSKMYGMLVVLVEEDNVDEFVMVAVERSATVAALEIMKEKAIFETEIRLQRDFIDELLSDKQDDEFTLVKRARDFGWNITKEFIILSINIDNFKESLMQIKTESEVQEIKTSIYNLIKKVMLRNMLSPIIAQRSDSFIVFLEIINKPFQESKRDYAHRVAGEIKKLIANHFSHICLSIGIGRPVKEIQKFKDSYKEANQALWIGRAAWGRGKIYNYEDMGVYRLLFSHKDTESLTEFYREFIEPLVLYDQKNGTDLVNTLEHYYNSNSNIMLTAEKLYIHRNTLNYRLKRIKEILGLDIDEAETKICLIMALKISRLLNL